MQNKIILIKDVHLFSEMRETSEFLNPKKMQAHFSNKRESRKTVFQGYFRPFCVCWEEDERETFQTIVVPKIPFLFFDNHPHQNLLQFLALSAGGLSPSENWKWHNREKRKKIAQECLRSKIVTSLRKEIFFFLSDYFFYSDFLLTW